MKHNNYFDDLYKFYYPKVYRLCKGYFNGNESIADDITQEIFIKVWENLSKFRNESNVSTWIFKIASNCCLMYLRKASSLKKIKFYKNESESETTNENEFESQLSKMYSCIQKLNPTDKLIIMMVLEGLSYEKIATIIEISEETLRVRIHRIKFKLTKCVQNEKI